MKEISPPKKAVIYARYSCSKQNEMSIEGQIEECTQFAKENNLVVVGQYVDRAISGRREDRPEFQLMIADSSSHTFDALIVWKTDRLSRDRFSAALYKKKLKDAGVKLYYAAEPNVDGKEAALIEPMLEGVAEFYSLDLSQKVRRTVDLKARECKANGGHYSLGYKVGEDGRFAIDEDKEPVVRRIFQEYADGVTAKKICEWLPQFGVKKLSEHALTNIIKNRRYLGIYMYAGVTVEGGMPRIIDDDLFERANVRIRTNKTHAQRARAKADYLLAGKLVCGYCGKPMTCYPGTSKTGKMYYYYSCRTKGCPMHSRRKEELEDIVKTSSMRELESGDIIDKITSSIENDVHKNDGIRQEIELIKKQISDGNIACDNLMKAVERGIATDAILTRLDEKSEELKKLKARLDDLNAQVTVPNPGEIKKALGIINSESDGDDLIRHLVTMVTVFQDRVTIVYGIKMGDARLHSVTPLFDFPADDHPLLYKCSSASSLGDPSFSDDEQQGIHLYKGFICLTTFYNQI